MFVPQNIHKVRNIVVSPSKQAAYAGALADAALSHRPRIDGGAFASLAKGFFSDADMAGKGHAFATMRQETQRDSGLQMSVAVSDWMAAWIAAFVMGKVTTSGAGPYTHKFVFEPTATQPPVTTIYCEDTSAVKYKMPDVAVSEAEFSGGDSGVIQAQFSLLGSGRHADGAILPSVPAIATPIFLLGSDVQILIGPPGAPVATEAERIKSWRVRLSQNLSLHRGPGSGLYASQTKVGVQRASVGFVMAAKDTDDIRGLFLANTEQELQININSGAAAQLKFRFPSIHLSAVQCGADGNDVIYNVECDEQALLKKGANDLVEVTVINSQATYLTLPA